MVLLILLFSISVYAQDPFEPLLDMYASYQELKSPELLYFQTNKGIYETGEDLWFKAYQLNAQTMALSSLSRTLYVQLFTETDSLVWQEKYPVEDGIAEGHIYLDENLPDGNYSLEAYTRYSFYKDSKQLNNIRKIRIQKNITDRENHTIPTDDTFRFDLFPEGGHLVSGIPSSLSFKATDGKGNPVEISGVLYEDEKELQLIKTTHAGMGTIFFTPSVNKEYYILLSDNKQYRLPIIHPEGVSLHFSGQDKESLEFVASQTGGFPQPVYLVGQIRGVVCCVAKGLLRDSLTIKMPLHEFPMQGIAEFTLFDSKLTPVAERLVYVHSEKKLHIAIEPNKDRYELREKGTLNIKVTDTEGNPVKAHLGVSIYDQLYTNPADPTTILTHCYLSSQVKGRIYDPVYYFNEENVNRLDALDLLLQTQGWSCYTWNNKNIPLKRTEILTDEVTGVLTIKDKKAKGTEQLIQISSAEDTIQLTWTDSTGCFIVSPESLQELRGGYLYLKPMLPKNFGPKLEIDDPFLTINNNRKVKEVYFPFIDLTQTKQEQILRMPLVSRDSVIQLDEVSVIAKARKPFRDKFMGKLDSLAHKNLGPWVCDCEKEPYSSYLEDYRSGYTHHPFNDYKGEKITPVNGKTYKIIKYEPKGQNGQWILTDVKSVVYNGPEYSEEELLRMNNLWRTKGYYAAREFYQPDEFDMQLSIPDARNTLLWAPSVITDENGEATVSFYCSDINTGFTVTVEGVDGLGLLGGIEREFRVFRY